MTVLFDTSVAIHMRDDDAVVVDRVAAMADEPVFSLVTVLELTAGLAANPRLAAFRRAGLERLERRFRILDVDRQIIRIYGEIVHGQGFSRARVFDLLIAATALLHELKLITINGSDFRDIPGLQLEVWPSAPAQ